jgi:hypothetical protein
VLSRIIGSIVMFLGILGVINPGGFKRRLVRKMNFRMKFIVYGFVLVFAVLILGSAITAESLMAKAGGIVGLIITIKVIMLITSKSSQKLSMWLDGKPLRFFRVWAVVVFVMGLMVYLG